MVRVRLFAHHADRFGPEISVDADSPITASELLQKLADQGLDVRGARIASGLDFAEANDVLDLTQEISLIPPVTGG